MKIRWAGLLSIFLGSATVAFANPGITIFRLENLLVEVPVALIAETYLIYAILSKGIRSRGLFVAAYLPFTFLTWIVLIFWPRYGYYYVSIDALKVLRDNLFLAEMIVVGVEWIYLAVLCRNFKRPESRVSPLWLTLLASVAGNSASFMIGGAFS